MIRDVNPGSCSWFCTHPGSRGQKGTGSGSATLDGTVSRYDPSMVICSEFNSDLFSCTSQLLSQAYPGNVISFFSRTRSWWWDRRLAACRPSSETPAASRTPFSPAASSSTAARCTTTAITRLCPTPPPSSLFSPRVRFFSFSCNIMVTGSVADPWHFGVVPDPDLDPRIIASD